MLGFLPFLMVVVFLNLYIWKILIVVIWVEVWKKGATSKLKISDLQTTLYMTNFLMMTTMMKKNDGDGLANVDIFEDTYGNDDWEY